MSCDVELFIFRTEGKFIRLCLESIQQTVGKQIQSGSVRAWVQWSDPSPHNEISDLREFFPRLGFIQTQRAEPSAAFDQVIRVAESEVLIFMHDDVIVTPGWLNPLLKAIKNEGVAVVGPRLMSLRNFTKAAESQPPLLGEFLSSSTREPHGEAGFADVPVSWVPHTLMGVRTSVYRRSGGFRRMRLGLGEDYDLCRRLALQGWKVLWCPEATVYHLGPESRRVRQHRILRSLGRLIADISNRNFRDPDGTNDANVDSV